MALLADQAPPSLLGQVRDQKRVLDELSKTVSRGVPALREPTGNVLSMASAPTPLLVASPQDVALRFTPETVSIVDSTGNDARTLEAGNLSAEAAVLGQIVCDTLDSDAIFCNGLSTNNQRLDTGVMACHAAYCDSLSAGGGAGRIDCGTLDSDRVFCNGISTNGGRADFGVMACRGAFCDNISVGGGFGRIDAGVTASGSIFTNSLRVTGGANVDGLTVNFGGIVNWGGYLAASDRQLKHKISDVSAGTAAGLLDELTPREFEWRDDRKQQGPVLGFVAQELPTRFQRPIPSSDDPDEAPLLGYDPAEILAAAVATIQQQAAQIADLSARVAALESAA